MLKIGDWPRCLCVVPCFIVFSVPVLLLLLLVVVVVGLCVNYCRGVGFWSWRVAPLVVVVVVESCCCCRMWWLLLCRCCHGDGVGALTLWA